MNITLNGPVILAGPPAAAVSSRAEVVRLPLPDKSFTVAATAFGNQFKRDLKNITCSWLVENGEALYSPGRNQPLAEKYSQISK